MKTGILALAIVGLTFLASSSASGQVRVEIPRIPDLPPMGFDGDLGAITAFQTGSSSRSISMTTENGVKKINAAEDGLRAYIEEQPDGAITVKITKNYGRDQLDEINEIEPELYMHLSSIPESTETAEVDFTVAITRTYNAATEEELKENHPEAFEVYERFTSGSEEDMARIRRGMSRAFPLEIRPSIRLQPLPGIRIHAESQQSDESSDSDSDSDSQQDKSSDEERDEDHDG